MDVLDHARVVSTVDAAIADAHWVVGTSTRSRRIPWPVAAPREIAEEIYQLPPESQVAILFGREDNGLTNEELQRCHYHLQIPASEDYPSLNLAMAVQVVCYELRLAGLEERIIPPWDRKLATSAQLDGMLEHAEETLLSTEFLNPDNPGQTMTRLRRLFTRVQLDETEIQILRGIFKHFAKLKHSNSGPI